MTDILLVEDMTILRDSLKETLNKQENLNVVASIDDARTFNCAL